MKMSFMKLMASLQINYRKVLRGEYSKSQFDKDYSDWKTNCYNNINKSGAILTIIITLINLYNHTVLQHISL